MDATEQRPEYLTVKELADLLGVSLRTGYALVESGQVPAVKVRSLWRVPRAELERQLKASAPAE